MKRLVVTLLGVLGAFAGTGAQALNVAVFNPENASGFVTVLTGYGHTVTTLTETQVASGVNAYDVLVLDHIDAFSATSCTSLANFLNAGKRVVTGWNAVYNLFTSPGAGLYYGQGTQCALFPGTVGQGDSVASNTAVTPVPPLQALLTGLPNPLQLGGGSEFFYLVSGFNPAVWTIASTYNGWSQTGNPAIMTANLGPGQVVAVVFDFGDVVGTNPTAGALLNNLVTQPLAGAAPTGPTLPVPTLHPAALFALTFGLFVLAWRRRARSAR